VASYETGHAVCSNGAVHDTVLRALAMTEPRDA
jgi:hypothetical protein